MIRKLFTTLLFLSVFVNLACLQVTPVAAATFTVSNNSDSGSGSLRQAILDAANAPGTDTIVFDSSLSGATITLTTGELTIGSDLTIDASALASPVTISGNNASRVFSIASGATVSLTGLIITQGRASGGGGIRNNGTLSITRCRITSNVSSDVGGGISNDLGTVTISESDISSNSATAGAGIFSSGTLTIDSSNISGNTTNGASSGGGLYLQADATIRNSTISGNDSGSAAAILMLNASSVFTLENCTITGNISRNAVVEGYALEFGLYPRLNISNTIIANSSYQTDTGVLVEGHDCKNSDYIAGTNTNNLIEDGTCSPTLSGDPLLGPLADNGGFTKTHALLAGSKALQAGAASAPTTDQRGVARPQPAGSAPDIGAYEVGIPTTFAATKSYPDLVATDTKPTVTLKLSRYSGVVLDTTFNPPTITLDGVADNPCADDTACELLPWHAFWSAPYDPAYAYKVTEPSPPAGFAPLIKQTTTTMPLSWTVENHKLAKLTLRKAFLPSGSGTPSLWTLSATKSGETTPALQGTADQSVSGFLAPGTYTLTEAGSETGVTAGTTWHCGAGNESVTSITLASGDDITCTITNTRSTVMSIRLNTTPKSSNLYSYKITPPSGSPITFNLADTGSIAAAEKLLENIVAGTWRIEQTGFPKTFQLTAIKFSFLNPPQPTVDPIVNLRTGTMDFQLVRGKLWILPSNIS